LELVKFKSNKKTISKWPLLKKFFLAFLDSERK